MLAIVVCSRIFLLPENVRAFSVSRQVGNGMRTTNVSAFCGEVGPGPLSEKMR
jgi:hypothetical protein